MPYNNEQQSLSPDRTDVSQKEVEAWCRLSEACAEESSIINEMVAALSTKQGASVERRIVKQVGQRLDVALRKTREALDTAMKLAADQQRIGEAKNKQ